MTSTLPELTDLDLRVLEIELYEGESLWVRDGYIVVGPLETPPSWLPAEQDA